MVILQSVRIVGNRLKEVISKNTPAIFTATAIGAGLTSTILAVRATPKALDILEKEGIEEPKEVVKRCYKPYIPSIFFGALSVCSVVALNKVHDRRNAALAGLYSATETSFREYRAKVKEQIGKNKETKIKDSIAKDKVDESPPKDNTVLLTGKGDVTCLDAFSGRYFKSDIESIRKTVNDLTEKVFLDDFVPINDFYHAIGLDGIKMGEETGWHSEDGTIDFRYSSQLSNGEPVLVVDYNVRPSLYT